MIRHMLPSDVRFRLAELLEEHRPEPMTQAELVRLSGVSTVTVNRIYLNRTGAVSLATLGAIATVLGCQAGDLLTGPSPAKRRRG